MDLPHRKPPQKVSAIVGEFRNDVVTAEELQLAVDLQATVWLAEKNAREYVQRLEHRLLSGARIEDCDYEFDPELQMVRTKRAPRDVKAG